MKEAHSGGNNVYNRAIELIPEDIDSVVLDLGSGNGHFVKMMKEEGYEDITCCDVENTMLFGYHVVETDLNGPFEFGDESFEIITALEVIEHLENPRHFLRECKRILKKDGCIILTTPNVQHLKARIKFLIKGVLYGFDKNDYEISGHITPITSQALRRICDELDLTIEDFTYNDYKKGNIIIRISKK